MIVAGGPHGGYAVAGGRVEDGHDALGGVVGLHILCRRLRIAVGEAEEGIASQDESRNLQLPEIDRRQDAGRLGRDRGVGAPDRRDRRA